MRIPLNTVPVSCAALLPGDIVLRHGYRWRVLRVDFDPLGNDRKSPRYVIRCESADGNAPEGYRDSMTLGVGERDTIDVEFKSEA